MVNVGVTSHCGPGRGSLQTSARSVLGILVSEYRETREGFAEEINRIYCEFPKGFSNPVVLNWGRWRTPLPSPGT